MALKVELKPGERVIIGDSLITNSDQRTRLYIEGRAPILREKDILTVETANTPAKRVYLAVQLMYLGGDMQTLHKDYAELTRDLVEAAPSTTRFIDNINNEILTGSLYKALKITKRLIAYEEELLAHATTGSTGIPTGRQADG